VVPNYFLARRVAVEAAEVAVQVGVSVVTQQNAKNLNAKSKKRMLKQKIGIL
jgi:NADH:ubiquinone oxidoreductase subunit K